MSALTAVGAALSTAACGPRPRPNVLFLAVDDLRDWTTGLGGHPAARTPNLERLTARGTLFTNAHCDVPLCGGSRTTVLTGMLPHTHRVFTNHRNFREQLPDVVTLPEYFLQHGYRVLGGGKVFHVDDPRSWHEVYIPEQPSLSELRTPDSGYGWPDRFPMNWGPLDVDDDSLWDGMLARWAEEKLAQSYDRPFFLAVGFFRPHLPWWVPRPYFELFPPHEVALPEVLPGDLSDVPDHARANVFRSRHRSVLRADQWHHGVASYLASVAFLDTQVGRVLDALEAGPHARNTVIVLWSDHGHHLGEKEHWSKFVLWEAATRVPLVVVAPGTTRPGGRCSRPVTLLHLYPTLLELCDLPRKEDLEGRSLVPLLRRPGARWPDPAVITKGGCSHSVRSQRWRYTVWGGDGEELYDHANDPHEWHNLASDPRHAEVKAELRSHLPPIGEGCGRRAAQAS